MGELSRHFFGGKHANIERYWRKKGARDRSAWGEEKRPKSAPQRATAGVQLLTGSSACGRTYERDGRTKRRPGAHNCSVQEQPFWPSRPARNPRRSGELATSRSNITGAFSPSSAASSRVREHDQSHERSDSGVNSVFGRATGGWWAGDSFPTFPGKAHSCQGSVEKLLHARSIELWPKPRQLVRLGLFDGWQLVHRTQL